MSVIYAMTVFKNGVTIILAAVAIEDTVEILRVSQLAAYSKYLHA